VTVIGKIVRAAVDWLLFEVLPVLVGAAIVASVWVQIRACG